MQFFKRQGRHKGFMNMSALFMLFMFSNNYAAVDLLKPGQTYQLPGTLENAYDKAVNHPPIPLLDEQGENVLQSKKPYSPKKSCEGSGCHDYEAITHAYHFEMGRDEASDTYGAKRGLPHLVSPGYYGGYTCMGGSNPQVLAKKSNPNPEDFADYGSAGWVKTCMTCHLGGGWAEKDRDGIRYDQKKVEDIALHDGDYYERMTMPNGKSHLMLWDWKKSGVGEADCLFCHIDFATVKMPIDSGLEQKSSFTGRELRNTRRAFSGKGFFRQAASGFMEYVVNKDGKNIMTVERAMLPNVATPAGHGTAAVSAEGESMQLALDGEGMPQFNWHADAFDENGRVTIPMLRFPGNDNCMACHATSNSRRGFFGFGEDAKATLVNASENPEDYILEDDYKDDVHKGKVFTDSNGEKRTINNCNACHSKQYFKPKLAGVDLNANHDFPKGNSDMDVRNDLDYAPDAKSCEYCHVNSKNPIIPSGHDSQLAAHRELWKGKGYMAGYSEKTLTRITQTHFDVVACQACHISSKKGRKGAEFQIMYRYRQDEDGKHKITTYNPRLRYRWLDKTSGRVLSKTERNSIFVKSTEKDAEGNLYYSIVDPISGAELGRVGLGRRGRAADPDSYEAFVAVKKAYDSLLLKKGYTNPNTTMMWSESNEYVISHNTAPSTSSVQCEECHARKQSGAYSALLSQNGILGSGNVKTVSTLPDTRLVEEGIVTLELPYMKLQENGDITENVADILYATKIDPFMSLLKNSSASEILGKFKAISTDSLMASVGPELGAKMAADFSSPNSYLFNVNKGAVSLRSMVAVIDGNTVNSILFPTYRGIMGKIDGIDSDVQSMLDTRNYGKLRSDVFYFRVLDSTKTDISSLNGAPMYVKVPYKGTKANINDINVVTADLAVTTVTTLPAENIVMLQPAIISSQNSASSLTPLPSHVQEGFVILKADALGYFVIADK